MRETESQNVPTPGGEETAAMWRHRIAWTAVGSAFVAVSLFAYRGLLTYDPLARAKAGLTGAEGAFFSPADSDPTLIFVLTGYLLYTRRTALARAIRRRASWMGASGLLAVASTLCLWAMYVDAPELLVPSLGLMLVGSGILFCGARGGRLLLLPAAFLMLAYRPPGLWINQVIHPLQRMVVNVSGGLLGWVGIESQSSGDMIATLGRVFHVIEECAGLRSIDTLLMAAIVYGETMRRPRRIRYLLIAASPLVAVVINEFRVLSLIFNPLSTFASIHTLQGLVMIVVGVLIIAGLDRIFEQWIPVGSDDPERERISSRDGSIPFVRSLPRLGGLAALLLVLGIAGLAVGTWKPQRSELPTLSAFPASYSGWKVAGRGLDREFLGSVGYSQWIHRTYTHRNLEVTLFMASNDRLDPRTSLLSRKSTLLGSSWQRVEADGMDTPKSPSNMRRKAEVSIQSTPFFAQTLGNVLVYSWYEGIGSLPHEMIRAALVLDRGPLRRPGRSIIVRLSTPITDTGIRAAEETLEAFLALTAEDMAEIIGPQWARSPI